jgi:hypothetical protein
LERLNEGFNNLGKTDVKAFKHNTTEFGNFITKVNSVDVEKVEKTAKLFEQMSNLTREIKGDFGALADALTDKLLPVLEDLKEVMYSVPEVLERGFGNTSASIAAVNQPQTTENVIEQIKRENVFANNMDSSQLEMLANKRIAEQTQAEMRGIGAKLDKLISMFKYSSSDQACVRTR